MYIMGMAIISDKVLKRMRKIKIKWKKKKPNEKHSYSTIIDAALDKLKEGV